MQDKDQAQKLPVMSMDIFLKRERREFVRAWKNSSLHAEKREMETAVQTFTTAKYTVALGLSFLMLEFCFRQPRIQNMLTSLIRQKLLQQCLLRVGPRLKTNN